MGVIIVPTSRDDREQLIYANDIWDAPSREEYVSHFHIGGDDGKGLIVCYTHAKSVRWVELAVQWEDSWKRACQYHGVSAC